MLDLTCDLKFAPLPICVRGEAHIISGDPKGTRVLYTNGHNVFIRELQNPRNCEIYSEHIGLASVARFSPSGNYIASGDSKGKVKIWELLPNEFKTKCEFPIFAGKIKDVSWDGEGKRIGICGFGLEYKAKVIMWDSGNNLGELSNIGKCGNSIAFKKNRPFRCVVAAESSSSVFFSGPPFKYTRTAENHSGFVNCAAFSPDGSTYVTCSSDKKIFIYEGKGGDLIGEFLDGKFAHDGGVYSVCFNKDGSELLSAGGDKKCKIWNVKDRTCVDTFVLGTDISNIPLASLWQGDDIVALTLNGHINFLDRENPNQLKKSILGHSHAIWGVARNPNDKNIVYTADRAGKAIQWDISTGEASYFKGPGHGKSKINALEFDSNNNKLVSIGNDDAIRFSCPSSLEFGESVALGSQPIDMVILENGYIAVLCMKELLIIKDGRKVTSHKFGDESEGTHYEPQHIGGHSSMLVVPLKSSGFEIFDLTSSGSLEKREEVKCSISAGPFAFSSCGGKLAVAQGNNTLRVYTLADGMTKYKDFYGHSSRMTKVHFSPNGDYIASTAGDNQIIVSAVANHKINTKFPHCHNKSYANDMIWLDDTTLVTVGNDAVTKFWKLNVE